MKFHQVILYGSRVMLIFAKSFHFFSTNDLTTNEYRAHYVNRFRDSLRVVQYTIKPCDGQILAVAASVPDILGMDIQAPKEWDEL